MANKCKTTGTKVNFRSSLLAPFLALSELLAVPDFSDAEALVSVLWLDLLSTPAAPLLKTGMIVTVLEESDSEPPPRFNLDWMKNTIYLIQS